MSMFSMPDDLMPNGKIFDEMMKETKALMPAEFAGAVNLMAHPLAGMAAMSALGLGFASHAAGIWFGALSGATAASQRMMTSAFDDYSAGADEFRDTGPTPEKRAKAAASLLIASVGIMPVAEDVAPPAAPRPVAEAKPAKALRVVETPPVELEAVPEAMPEIKKPAARKVVKAVPPVVKDVPPVVEVIEPVAELQELAAAATVVAEAPPAPVAEHVVPEGPRKPASIGKPDMPDDLKAISGIGPKLEQVLNGFGVWTYVQVAGWGAAEVAWVDDTLGFKGRIDRDGWIGQAAALAGAKH